MVQESIRRYREIKATAQKATMEIHVHRALTEERFCRAFAEREKRAHREYCFAIAHGGSIVEARHFMSTEWRLNDS